VASAQESALSVGWVEEHLFLGISSMSVDSLGRTIGMEGTQTCCLTEALLGVSLSWSTTFYNKETQRPASSRLEP
jgi:hypothetical protein